MMCWLTNSDKTFDKPLGDTVQLYRGPIEAAAFLYSQLTTTHGNKPLINDQRGSKGDQIPIKRFERSWDLRSSNDSGPTIYSGGEGQLKSA